MSGARRRVDDDIEPTWWDRQVCRTSFTMWAWSWVALGRSKVYGLYDSAMLHCWPYGLFPGEWKDLVFGPSKKEGEK